MKEAHLVLLLLATILGGLDPAGAAEVGPTGYTNSFANQPPATDWAAAARTGGSTDLYDLDSDVNTNFSAEGVTARTTPSSLDPAVQAGPATWSSTGLYLQTRPTSVRYTVLLGKFVNASGTNATQVMLSYARTIAQGGVLEEDSKGTHVYFSLTGLTNSWINLPTLNSVVSSNSRTVLRTNIALNWPVNSPLYLLWADDNSLEVGGADAANQIDDFALQVTAGQPPLFSVALQAPSHRAVFVTGSPILTAVTAVSGLEPYALEYFTNNGLGNTIFTAAGTATATPYSLVFDNLAPGTYNIYAQGTDSSIAPAAALSTTNTFSVADPIALTLNVGALYEDNMEVTATAAVSGGTPPYSVQFYLDGTASGAAVSSAPYQRNFGALFVGIHTVGMAATDGNGWSSNAPNQSVGITGPLGGYVLPTNGASYVFGEQISLASFSGGGMGPYQEALYLNGLWLASFDSPYFSTNLGILPTGSYTSYLHLIDSTIPVAQAAFSRTNVFEILPNPLSVTLTNPTNGLSSTAGQSLGLAATASVSPPLTILNVQFIYDDSPAGTDNTAPYGITVSNITAGTHTVLAVVTDSLGRQSYSLTTQITTAVTPGSNNNFANALPLTGLTVTTTGVNQNATKESGEPNHAGYSGGGSLWWNWTAPDSGVTIIDTFSSSFDTLLGVYVGNSVSQLTPIASSDDYNGAQSRIQFTAVAGTVYRVAVDGYGGARGNIVLHLYGPSGLTLQAPTNGLIATVGEAIQFQPRFSTNFPAQTVRQISVYRGSLLVGGATTPPFTALVTNSPPGTNSFYIVASTSTSQSYTSETVNVFVQTIGVILLSPANGSYYATTNPIAVNAWAYLPFGAITNIEFFVDGQKFDADATAPYRGTWTRVSGGSHRLTAVGQADTGASYFSPAVNIGVYVDLFGLGTTWRYLDSGSNPGTNWIAPLYDDSSWPSGPSPLGYGDSDGRLPATIHASRRITSYYRKTFLIPDRADYLSLNTYLEMDDGAVIYLNGREVDRLNMPAGPVTPSTLASSPEFADGDYLYYVFASTASFLTGTNVLAVEVHQNTANDSDSWFQLYLQGVPVIRGNASPEVVISSPTNNQSFLRPAAVNVQGSSTDQDGAITKVEFFVDTAKQGETTNAVFSFAWTAPSLGAHFLNVVATDDTGAARSSGITVFVYDALGTPLVRILTPNDGFALEGGTNFTITASASGPVGLTSVRFFSGTALIGEDTVFPFNTVWDASSGTNFLQAVALGANGLSATSAVVRLFVFPNSTPPTIATQIPLAGASVSELTTLRVIFSERVQHVEAADLLVNGLPATGLSGGGSNYFFTFPQPHYGRVEINWRSSHGIADFGYPADLPLDELNPNARWDYTLIDSLRPTISARAPAAGATVTNLTQISVLFSEAVTHVDATDLRINGAPAVGLAGEGSNYIFSVAHVPDGVVNLTWTTSHGITDLAIPPNAFDGTTTNATWSVRQDPRVILVQSNSNWRFVKGLADPSTPPNAWTMPSFDDSSWTDSPAPFFYGDPYSDPGRGIFGTLLSDMQDSYTTIFLRQEFFVADVGTINSLFINHQSDDAFAAWINGVEVFRYNVGGGDLRYNSIGLAAGEVAFGGAPYILTNLAANAARSLVNGRNVLAVLGLNQASYSSDFGFNAQVFYYPDIVSENPPRLASANPPAGDVLALTNVLIRFNEGVSGVDASDLLINGQPAESLSSVTNTTYQFSFPQPAYGPVLLSWTSGHGIADFDNPPRTFVGVGAGATLSYSLFNVRSPRIAAQVPRANTTVGGLTLLSVTFSQPVSGVDASDLLINGHPATSVISVSNLTYTFSFAQPSFGQVTVRWATNQAIQDFEVPPNVFDSSRFGGEWNYTVVDPVPFVAITSPTNNSSLLAASAFLVSANASDQDGTVARVEFFVDSTKLGETTNAPYSVAVSNLFEGTYLLRAVAIDNAGLVGTSAPVVLNVVTSLPVQLVRGPYLQVGTPSSALVRWRTDFGLDGLVQYGSLAGQLTNRTVQATFSSDHIVQLSGLQPDTTYFYSVTTLSTTLAGGTNGSGTNFWFRTSPLPGTRRPFRVWALGDSGTATYGPFSADKQRAVRNAFYDLAAHDRPADLWLMLGDNAYGSGQDSEYQTALFDIYPDTLRNLFLWPTIGNHESSQSYTAADFPYLHIFSLPHNAEAGGVASGTSRYYSFDYGNIHFICLDSMTSGRTTNSPMAQWLQSDLASTVQDWIIAYFHHPPYTHASHNSDIEGDLVEVRQNIVPILEANGVDLVLSGHSHIWERSYLLNGHYGNSSTLTSEMKVNGGDGREEGDGAYHKDSSNIGTTYIVAGNGGQTGGGSLDHPAHFISLNELGSLVLDVDGDRLDAMMLSDTGVSRDHFTLIKSVPPPAPAGLLAVALSSNSVDLTWTGQGTNELGYVMERSTDGVLFQRIATNSTPTTNLTDHGLTAHVTYFYRVRAFNLAGESNPSSIVSVVPGDNAAPTAGPDHFYTFHDQRLVVPIAALLTNDFDLEGDAFSFTGFSTNTSRGGAIAQNGASWEYDPPLSFLGDDTFSYTLTDARGGVGMGWVTVSMHNNVAPVLVASPDLFAHVLTPLYVTNGVSDANVGDALTFSLEAGTPTNVVIDSRSGLLRWIPNRDQARSTNLFTLKAADNGTPSLTHRMSFHVVVNDYLEVWVGSAIVPAGASNSVAIDLFSSGPLSAVRCLMSFPPTQLHEITFEELEPNLATMTVERNDPDGASVLFSATPGNTLQGLQRLARLKFAVAPFQPSAFVPIRISPLDSTGIGLSPTLLKNDGRVVIQGAQALLEARRLTVDGARELVLYGRSGATYTVESRFSLQEPWTFGASWSLTNTMDVFPAPDATAPSIFYRLRE